MNNIETVKKYWNSRPCNIRHSSKDIGTIEYFEEVEKKKFFVEPHILPFSDFPSWKNKNVLEIGCGIGTMAVNFAKHGANYTGVELSNESLDLTKKRFEVYGFEGLFYQGNAEELTSFIPAQKYDLIYSFGVIHHSPNPKKIIQEINPPVDVELIDIKISNIDEETLDWLKTKIGSYEALFSKRAIKFRELSLNQIPVNDNDFKELLLKEYTFLKRPFIIDGENIAVGNSKAEIQKAVLFFK